MQIKYAFYIFVFTFISLAACKDANNKKSSEENRQQNEDLPDESGEDSRVILFYGNSLTAGYGVEEGEGFPELIADTLDSLGYQYEVINAGVSGETTASGLSRVDWVVKRQPVDIFVLELGANDGLRGLPTEETESNLRKIIDKVRELQPNVEIILAGMMVPPNMGPEYSEKFKHIFPEIAEEKNVDLIPFLLQDVGGLDSLNQEDGIHPNPAGHRILAKNVWDVLEDKVEKQSN